MGSKDALFPPNFINRIDVHCLTYKANKERYDDNSSLFGAVYIHKTGSNHLEKEVSNFFIAYRNANPKLSAANFQVVKLEV